MEPGTGHGALDTGGTAMYSIIVVLLVLGAGLMSGLTLGLLSLDLLDLQVLRVSGSPRQQSAAGRLIPLVAKPHWLLCTLLLCNAACMEALPLFLDRLLNPIGAILLSVTAILVFGEIIPQAVCSRYGVAIGATLAPLVRLLMLVCAPITWPLGKLLDAVLGHEDVVMKRQQLKAMVQLHGEGAGLGGRLTQQEVSVIHGAMDLRYKTAISAMTPLSKVFMLSDSALLDEGLVRAMLHSGHSRVPVYRGSNPLDFSGLILVKEVLQFWRCAEAPRVNQLWLRPLPRLPADTPMLDVLRYFQTGNSHMVLLTAPEGSDLEEFKRTKGWITTHDEDDSSSLSRHSSASSAASDTSDDSQGSHAGTKRSGSGRWRLSRASFSSSLRSLRSRRSADHGRDHHHSGEHKGSIECSPAASPLPPSGSGSCSAGTSPAATAAVSVVGAHAAQRALELHSCTECEPLGGQPVPQQQAQHVALQVLGDSAAAHQQLHGWPPRSHQQQQSQQQPSQQPLLQPQQQQQQQQQQPLHLQHLLAGTGSGSSCSSLGSRQPGSISMTPAAAGKALAAANAAGGGEEEEADRDTLAPLQHQPAPPGSLSACGLGARQVAVGIITLEDVLEEILQSEIVDETDTYVDNDRTKPVDLQQLFEQLPPHVHTLLRAEMLQAAQNFIRTAAWTPGPTINPNNVRQLTAIRAVGYQGAAAAAAAAAAAPGAAPGLSAGGAGAVAAAGAPAPGAALTPAAVAALTPAAVASAAAGGGVGAAGAGRVGVGTGGGAVSAGGAAPRMPPPPGLVALVGLAQTFSAPLSLSTAAAAAGANDRSVHSAVGLGDAPARVSLGGGDGGADEALLSSLPQGPPPAGGKAAGKAFKSMRSPVVSPHAAPPATAATALLSQSSCPLEL